MVINDTIKSSHKVRVPFVAGESALHIAIVYGEFDMVKRLVESGANVNQRATGTFFLPEDQKMAANTATNYEGWLLC